MRSACLAGRNGRSAHREDQGVRADGATTSGGGGAGKPNVVLTRLHRQQQWHRREPHSSPAVAGDSSWAICREQFAWVVQLARVADVTVALP